MYWLRTPDKVYFKRGCLSLALDELKAVYGKKRAMIVTANSLYLSRETDPIEKELERLGISHFCYSHPDGEMTLSDISEGAGAMRLFEPDVIIAYGDCVTIDSAKAMRLLYEYPNADIMHLSESCDVFKGDGHFPKLGEKALLAAVPSVLGKGAQVSPFSVVPINSWNYVLRNYELMPEIAVVDSELMAAYTKPQISEAGLTALAQAFYAYNSPAATDYSDSFVIKAADKLFSCFEQILASDSHEPALLEEFTQACTLAGIAYANTDCPVITDWTGEFAKTGDMISQNEERFVSLAGALKTGDCSVSALAEKIRNLVSLCGY